MEIIISGVPFEDSLAARNISVDTSCLLCGSMESDSHLFIYCNSIQELWFRIGYRSGWDSSTLFDFLSFGVTELDFRQTQSSSIDIKLALLKKFQDTRRFPPG